MEQSNVFSISCSDSQVFFYSNDMFTMAGLTDGKVFFGILATGVINLIATLVALKLIELLGRRPLIIWPLAMIIVVMVALTIIIVVNVSSKKRWFTLTRSRSSRQAKRDEDKREALAIVSIVFILIFIVLFAVGLGPIPYVYSNEVFAAEARSAGLSLAMFVVRRRTFVKLLTDLRVSIELVLQLHRHATVLTTTNSCGRLCISLLLLLRGRFLPLTLLQSNVERFSSSPSSRFILISSRCPKQRTKNYLKFKRSGDKETNSFDAAAKVPTDEKHFFPVYFSFLSPPHLSIARLDAHIHFFRFSSRQ